MRKMNQKSQMKVFTTTLAGKIAIHNLIRKSRSLQKKESIIYQRKRIKAKIKKRRSIKAIKRERKRMNRRKFN